jgi:hypothetical protein
MKKVQLLWWVNLGLLVSFLIQASTGLFREVIAWRIFEPLHGYNGWLFIVLAVSHLILNWNWIKTNFIARFMWRTNQTCG